MKNLLKPLNLIISCFLLFAVMVFVPATASSQNLVAVSLRGGPSTVHIDSLKLSYGKGKDIIYVVITEIAGMSAEPGQTVTRQLSPPREWPHDFLLHYKKDGAQGGLIVTPVEPNHWYSLSPSEIMFVQEPDIIPTMTEWGLIILALLIMSTAVWILMRRRARLSV